MILNDHNLHQIKSNQIKSNQIKSNQIKSNQIKSNQIKSNQIKSNQIKSNQIKSNQIKSNQIKTTVKGSCFLILINCGRESESEAGELEGLAADCKKQGALDVFTRSLDSQAPTL